MGGIDPNRLAKLAAQMAPRLSEIAGPHDLTDFERWIQDEVRRRFLVFCPEVDVVQRIFIGELIRRRLDDEESQRTKRRRRVRPPDPPPDPPLVLLPAPPEEIGSWWQSQEARDQGRVIFDEFFDPGDTTIETDDSSTLAGEDP